MPTDSIFPSRHYVNLKSGGDPPWISIEDRKPSVISHHYHLEEDGTTRSRDADVSPDRLLELMESAVVCTVLGGFLLLFGLTSFLVRGKLFLSTAVIAITFGMSFFF
jgi:hypothetical protein